MNFQELQKIFFKIDNKIKVELLFITLLTAIFSLWGGLPFYHPDFLVDKVHHILNNNGNPNFFNYPGLVLYIHSFFYILIPNIIDFFKVLIPQLQLSLTWFQISHLITTIFSITGSILVYKCSYIILHNRIFAFCSSLILTTSLMWTAHSHYITVDLPLAVCCILTIYLSLKYIKASKKISWLRIFMLGGTVGLCASAKYNGFLIIFSVLLPLIYVNKNQKKLLLKQILLLFASSLFIFLLTNPFILLNFNDFFSDFMYEMRHAQEGHFGYQNENNFLYHLQNSLIHGFSLPLLLTSFISMIIIVITQKFTVNEKLTLLSFPLIFYFFMGASSLSFQRYMVPLIPFLSVFSSISFFVLLNIFRNYIQQNYINYLIIGILFLLILFPNIKDSIHHNQLLSIQDTREELIQVLNDLPSSLYFNAFTGMYMTSTLNSSNFQENIHKYYNSIPSDSLNIYLEMSQLILFWDSFSHDRLLYDSASHNLKKNYKDYKNLSVIQINPFSKPKSKVPFSPGSLYSPYRPDLKYRKKPGPFIEIYISSSQLSEEFLKALQKNQINYKHLSGENSYYLSEISPKN